MTTRDPVELDPELLEDPVPEEPSSSKSLVPAGETGLAPADPFRRYLA